MKEGKYDKDKFVYRAVEHVDWRNFNAVKQNYLNKLKHNCLALINSAVQEFKLNSFLTTSEGGISSM